jgi:uncharacterized membrane protein YhhN
MMHNLWRAPWLTIAVLGGFGLDWFAVGLNWKKLKLIAKPLAMVLVILWTLNAASWQLDLAVRLLLAAQVFGLAGDVFLMLSKRWFLFGLAAFLVGHLLYLSLITISLINWMASMDKISLPLTQIFFSLALYGIILDVFYRVFKPLKDSAAQQHKLWPAVQLYGWVLAGLVALGILFFLIQEPSFWGYSLLPIGAFLFLVSDFLLAYDRFISSVKYGQLLVHVTYHLAQFSLAIGFVVSIIG